jgi:predicted kinase
MTRQEFLDSLRPGMALVMRGAPGSGKSTLVEAIKAHAKTLKIAANDGAAQIPWVGVSSADAFRMVNGQYVFKPEENGLMHGKCLKDFIRLCTAHLPQFDIVVCDNTNIAVDEIAPYVAISAAYGYQPLIVNVQCDPRVAADRNLHGVPVANVYGMAHRALQAQLPKRWDQVTITQE